MNWEILEHRDIGKVCKKLPVRVVKKYELWKNIVFRHGPDKLKEFPGFRDEALRGKLKGHRASRLSLFYRVIYTVKRSVVTVYVEAITPHKY